MRRAPRNAILTCTKVLLQEALPEQKYGHTFRSLQPRPSRVPFLDFNTASGCLYAYQRSHARQHSEITGTRVGVRKGGVSALERPRQNMVSNVDIALSSSAH